MAYTVRKEDSKFVVYKNDKPLLLPCKLTKLKKVEFEKESEAKDYIRYINKLFHSGKEYLEIY
tara:strand:- start:2401 stop:2589 length:189 start_codon:yes stop_codon:yes gene_type:complete